MENVTCSEVQRTHSWVRYICPIQSWGQLLSVFITYALGLSVIAIVIYLIAPTLLSGGLIGATLGGSAAVYGVLPARFELTTQGEARHFVKSVQEKLVAAGYRDVQAVPGGLHFRLASPRWQRWTENEIDLVARDHVIELTGPTYLLHLLKRILERSTA